MVLLKSALPFEMIVLWERECFKWFPLHWINAKVHFPLSFWGGRSLKGLILHFTNSGDNQEAASRLRFYLLHFAPRKLCLHLRLWIKDSQFFTHPFWLSRQSKLRDNDSSFSCQQRTSLEGKKRKTFSHFPKVIRYNRCTCSKLHEMMVHFTHWLGSVVCNPELESVVENCLQTTLQFAKIFKKPLWDLQAPECAKQGAPSCPLQSHSQWQEQNGGNVLVYTE